MVESYQQRSQSALRCFALGFLDHDQIQATATTLKAPAISSRDLRGTATVSKTMKP